MRRKQLFSDARFEFQPATDGPGTFAGYAVHFNQPLRSGDIVEPGAFADSLAEFVKTGAFLMQHDWESCAVGYFTAAREDATGVWVEGVFHSTEDAQAARTVAGERLAAGKTVPLSVGFYLEECAPLDVNDRWGPCKVTKGQLMEVSMVGVGNDPNAGLAQTNAARDGATFADHSQAVLDAVEEFTERARGLRDLRAFEGRALSQANVDRLCQHASAMEECAKDLREMVASAMPKETPEDKPDGASCNALMIPHLLSIEHRLADARRLVAGRLQ